MKSERWHDALWLLLLLLLALRRQGEQRQRGKSRLESRASRRQRNRIKDGSRCNCREDEEERAAGANHPDKTASGKIAQPAKHPGTVPSTTATAQRSLTAWEIGCPRSERTSLRSETTHCSKRSRCSPRMARLTTAPCS
ncbi:hypothetical protein CAPTEDRAFT_206492 [Capitella teleta]|uniref:Secreted protein n=1 Tax=Capitella teleta TaxID=283909 RepID=R7TAJ2_CAPTE|nr:hypothetical protein CAPTEDRAFT_206492 [Capitella teleta]|eukprot:ELT88029.1 hypothetical protein CAPTEDRAFT_206492 [Capitella teleta]